MTLTRYIFILILLFSCNTKTIADELPDLGERSETFISQHDEKRLGKEFMKEVRLNLSIIDDTIINNYIQQLGNKLASNTNSKKKKFHFFVVNDAAINAFAGPDAHIGINSGTILAVHSESELAAVMAHEIAHVTQHHIAYLIKKITNTQIATAAGMLAALILEATVSNNTSKNLATGAAMASMGGASQQMINFTRDHEMEADNIGMKILYNSSFSPKAMPDVFKRMQRLRHDYISEIPKFLLTHPVTSDRIAEAENRADQYPRVKETKSQDTFSLIRARLSTLTAFNSPHTIKNWQSQLKHQKNNTALQYGYATYLYNNLQLTKATTIVNDLQKKYPDEILFQMLAAQLALANKQTEYSLDILKKALITHENYHPLIIQYGQTLINTKHSQIACDFIRKKIRRYPDDSNLYCLLAQAYAQNNQIADAYQAKAKMYAIEGYNRQAILLLQQALKVPKLTTTDRAIINAKIEQYREAEKNI